MNARALIAVFAVVAASAPARAHGPLFSPAPETIFKGGTEVTLGFERDRASDGGRELDDEALIEVEYGITANWQAGFEIPYERRDDGPEADGLGDITLETKYQFWGLDLPGAQYKASAFVQVEVPSGDDDANPALGSDSVDLTAGLTTGYESRRWYWFASGVVRANGKGDGGFEKGDRQFLNAVGGVRPVLTPYDRPDTVLMLELNWERADRDTLNGARLANTGGWELFVSPVLWWTYRQFAFRGGVQIPVARDLNEAQASSDYRVRAEFVYHF